MQAYGTISKLLERYPEIQDDFSQFMLPQQAFELGCQARFQSSRAVRVFLRRLEVSLFVSSSPIIQPVLSDHVIILTYPTAILSCFDLLCPFFCYPIYCPFSSHGVSSHLPNHIIISSKIALDLILNFYLGCRLFLYVATSLLNSAISITFVGFHGYFHVVCIQLKL